LDNLRLLKAVKERLPFRVAQRLLGMSGFPKGQSWTAILEKLDEKDAAKAADYHHLEKAFVESLAVSEKSMSLFRLSDSEMSAAYAAIKKLEVGIPESPFQAAFPYMLSEQQLTALPSKHQLPVAMFEWEKATAIIFCGPRTLETREEIPSSAINGDSDVYSSIIGIKRTTVQSFNAVVIPHFGNTIEVYIDAPSGIPEKPIEIDHFGIVIAFNKLVGSNVLKKKINLFPTIANLYASNEGTVSHLSHTVSTSVKHEKMRGAGRCVRKELFHAGGFKAVDGQISPFSIGIIWGIEDESMTSSNPSISIDGTYMMSYQSNPTIDVATMRKCASYEDAAYVVERVLVHLPQDE
jgi:hypothetical protein